MGNSASKVVKLRKKRSRKKQLNDSGNSDDSSSYFSKGSFSEETTSSDYIEIQQEYTNTNLESYYNSMFAKLWGMEYSASVDDIMTTMGRVLDVGCGSGAWLINMSQTYPIPEYTGMDPNPITNVVYPPNLKMVKGDLSSFPFDESQFDFVRMSNFACTFTDNELLQGISEMLRVTKCGGWIEFWEIEALIPKNAPIYSKFLENLNGFMALNGIDAMSATKLEYFLHNTRKLDNIQCSLKHIIVGQKGGEIGSGFVKALSHFFLELQYENLSKYMGVSREEYKREWTIVLEEIEKSSVEMILFKIWAQKKANSEVD